MQGKISKYRVSYFNKQEFHVLKKEIFTNDCYYFESKNSKPTIIDVGSYIGLSILYFKTIYPNCKIIAFEPIPESFKKLEENIYNNDIQNVELHNSAIWDVEGKKEIYLDTTGMERFSVASFVKDAWNREVPTAGIEVKTEMLCKYLNKDVDLLKLDVEGSEEKILKSITAYFKNIRNIIVEYHPTESQNIDKTLNILRKNYDVEVLYEAKAIKKKIPKDKLLTIKATYKY